MADAAAAAVTTHVVDVRVWRVLSLYAARRARLIVRVVNVVHEDDDAAAPAAVLPLYLALDDNDVVASYAPTLVQRVRVERRLDIETGVRLAAAEEARQRAPSSTAEPHAAAAVDGRAPVYRALEALDVVGRADALRLSALVSFVPSAHRGVAAAAWRRLPSAPLTSATAALAAVDAGAPALSAVERACLRRVIVDAFDYWEPVLLAARGIASPTALERAPADGHAVASLAAYVASNTLDVADARFVGRYAHFMPPNIVRTRHALGSSARRHAVDDGCVPFAAAVADAMRSTVLRLTPDEVPEAALRHRVLVSLGDGRYAFARDREFELDVADAVRNAADVELLQVAGDVRDVLAALDARFEPDAVYVAPTPGHAAVCPFTVFSVDDIVAGRLDAAAIAGRTIVVLFAHAFGVDSLSTTLRVAGDAGGGRYVLVGDPYAVNGSPRCNDRGAPFRDLCKVAASARYAHMRTSRLLGRALETRLGPFSAEEHRALRHPTTPTLLPTAPVHLVASVYDAEPSSERLVVVGDQRRAMAREHGVGAGYVALPCAGYLGRATAVHVGAEPATDAHAYGATVDVASSTLDHRYCCFTSTRSRLEPAAHACFTLCTAPLARALARIVPEPCVDAVALVLTERSCAADVLAAASLLRDGASLYVVGSQAALDAALARRGTRPCTALVDMLLTSDAVAAARSPLPSLVASVDDGATPLPSGDGVHASLAFVGATSASTHRRRVCVRTLRRALDGYLANTPLAGGRVPSDAVRAAHDARYEQLVPFDVRDVDNTTLAALDDARLGAHLHARILSLMYVSAPAVGEAYELSRHDMADAIADYPPRYGDERERAREATIVHLLAVVVKPSARLRAWLLDAEEQLLTTLADDDDAGARHRAALAAHLDDDTAVPLVDLTSDDGSHWFRTLGAVRAFLEGDE